MQFAAVNKYYRTDLVGGWLDFSEVRFGTKQTNEPFLRWLLLEQRKQSACYDTFKGLGLIQLFWSIFHAYQLTITIMR